MALEQYTEHPAQLGRQELLSYQTPHAHSSPLCSELGEEGLWLHLLYQQTCKRNDIQKFIDPNESTANRTRFFQTCISIYPGDK
uniref:Uncharacterized protein LOC8262552 n=1 Tax=Rhizophora mucronata TaxID=61149 RepID=A0A2P2MF80_RHIMU